MLFEGPGMSTRQRLVICGLLTLMAGAPGHGDEPRRLQQKQPTGAVEAPVVLCLARQETNTKDKRYDGGILIREIFRQALLIAARDGLGLSTRDMTLREPFASGPDADKSVLDMLTTASIGRFMVIEVTRGRGEDKQRIWKKKFPLTNPSDIDYDKLVEAAEAFSRGEMVDALKAAGFSGRANVKNDDAVLPDGVEQRLRQMTFAEQFAALRQIHTAIRTDGESLATLGALVRAYANLGQLTQFYWTAAHKAFKARALLYAERMVAAYPASCTARWHRAYARALVGLHGLALGDLAEAGKRCATTTQATASQPSASPAQPTWVPLIETYCYYNNGWLAKAASSGRDNAQLASLLWFLSLERCGSRSLKLETGRTVLQAVPECFRVWDAMCDESGVSNLHRVTVLAPEALAKSLPHRLLGMPNLPEQVEALVKISQAASPTADLIKALVGALVDAPPPDRSADRLAQIPLIARALLEAGAIDKDRIEPSWAVLARLIHELVFVQTYRRSEFIRHQWCLPMEEVRDYLMQTVPAVADHPYRALIDSYALDSDRDRQAVSNLFQPVEIVDADLTMTPLMRAMWNIATAGKNPAHEVWSLPFRHVGDLAGDLEEDLQYNSELARPPIARRLLRVSPYSPVALAWLIDSDPGYAQEHAAELEKNYGKHLAVMAALARRYSSLKWYDDAERCLKRCIAIAPDRWAYKQLADNYLEQGHVEKWQTTLDEYLRQPDLAGLDHARVRVAMARQFISCRQYAKAVPYAEEAAQTWAGWAMKCASECYECLRQWDKAELWIRRNSERYDSGYTRLGWYLWCKRTGRGDVDASRELAAEHLRVMGLRASPDDLNLAGIFYILNEQPTEAVQTFQKAFAQTSSPYTGLYIAILADQAKDSRTRDSALKAIAEKGGEYKYNGEPLKDLIELGKLFQECLAKGPNAWPDLSATDELVERASQVEKTNLLYFIGRFLELRGHSAWGEKYLQRSATTQATHKWSHVLARDLLRSRGVKLGEVAPRPAH